MRKVIESCQHNFFFHKGDIPAVKRAIHSTVLNAKQDNYLEEK